MPHFEHCSEAEVKRYLDVYFDTRKNLQNDRDNLERRKLAADATSDELNEIEVTLLWIAAKLAKLDDRRTAFLNGVAAIKPPSNELVEKVKALTAKSERLTNNAIGAQNAIKLSAAALEQFNAIQANST